MGESIGESKIGSPMKIRIALILSFLLLTGADATQPAAPQPPATTESSDSVAKLIAQLDAAEFGVREQAEKKLSDMGPAVEPRLRQALNLNLSDEARTRLNDVLSRLDEAMVSMPWSLCITPMPR